jgi:hypothetical protein
MFVKNKYVMTDRLTGKDNSNKRDADNRPPVAVDRNAP